MRYLAIGAVVVAVMGGTGTKALAADDWDGWDAWRRQMGGGGAGGGGGVDREFSGRAVEQAIERAKDYLWRARGGEGSWPSKHNGKYPTGASALAAYALLASGVDPKVNKDIVTTLEWLAKTPDTYTYSLGLRCNAWYLANKMTGGRWREPFRKDLRPLLAYTANGAYNYPVTDPGTGRWDNSNSQYGLLGTWAGKMANEEIPEQYWKLVMRHWTGCQNADGGWGYQSGNSSATMTAGGVASVFVCFDSLLSDKFVGCNVSQEYKPIADGLEWMDRNFVAALGGGGLMGHGDLYYYLYGVERVGLASGYKYFGTHDWYKLGAMRLLQSQGGGSWRGKFDEIVSTSYALLFLVRGRDPIPFNKLQFDTDWNNRPRDLAGLTRWMSDSLERTLNWQIINLKVPVEEWHDAPILYISGSLDPNFSDEQIGKLRTFVWQGGTIFSVTECGGRGFSQGIRKAYARMFPDYPMRQVPRDHPLYVIQAKLLGSPPFYTVENGVRPLVIHTDVDLSKAWQLQMKQTEHRSFQAASNVMMYVTDMGQLRARGVSHWPPAHDADGPTIRVVRIRYKGIWDPEPLAYERFKRLLAIQARVKLEVLGPVEMAQVNTTGAKIAALTGTDAFTTTAEDRGEMKKFIESGGTLIVDGGGGSAAFNEAAEVLLRAMFGRDAIRPLSSRAEVYRIPGFVITSVKYRRQAKVILGRVRVPNLRGVMVGQRVGAIFSKEDITGGLVGCPCYSSIGYEPTSAYEVMRNCLLYAAKVTPAGGARGKPKSDDGEQDGRE